MLQYIIKRLLYMIPTLIAISIVSFIIINLPPGDFVDQLVAQRRQAGEQITPEEERGLREIYGLNVPLPVQYVNWISDIVLRGDFGISLRTLRPVRDMIGERLALTLVLSISSLLFIWVVAIPIGVFSAVRQYSLGDYLFTFIGFIGLAIPNFLVALLLLYISFRYFDQSVGGLFSPEYIGQPWSINKVLDMFSHLWIPMVVLGAAGTASLIRTLRANLLDELRRPYVTTARTKGMPETRLLIKYPLRHALNPFVSGLNDVFVGLVSGETIVAIVLSLQTVGPMLFDSLRSQDIYLAGSLMLFISVLAVIGTLMSDILLAWVDPRIRYR
ncbi:MAG: ABC transporter permease [Anaerolineae bacterium]